MTFQVIVPTARRGIECGGVRVEFIARRDMHATPVVQRNTAVGVLRVASPEATALELMGYPNRISSPHDLALARQAVRVPSN